MDCIKGSSKVTIQMTILMIIIKGMRMITIMMVTMLIMMIAMIMMIMSYSYKLCIYLIVKRYTVFFPNK